MREALSRKPIGVRGEELAGHGFKSSIEIDRDIFVALLLLLFIQTFLNIINVDPVEVLTSLACIKSLKLEL